MSREILDQINILKSQVDALMGQNQILLENQRILTETISKNFATKTLDIKALAERYAMHVNTLYQNPWRLPNYGRSDFDAGKARWRLATVLEWEKKGMKEHQADWNNMTAKERKKLAGVA